MAPLPLGPIAPRPHRACSAPSPSCTARSTTSPLPTNGLCCRGGPSWPPPYHLGVHPDVTAMASGRPPQQPPERHDRPSHPCVQMPITFLCGRAHIPRTSMRITARPIDSTAHTPADPCAVKGARTP
ncbi:hypothetical protein GY45DRAFT_255812 [Cubamyces sp. BRFM 1775]|nr:hypothetical protein GY45DRAFT_255812 [Cubamyces sp. BRFM 1775]